MCNDLNKRSVASDSPTRTLTEARGVGVNINATIIGQSIAFFVFVWFCMKYVWPPIMQVLSERQKKIAEGLEAAERASRDLELTQKNVAEKLREAKKQSQAIIEQANHRATQLIEESKKQARVEGDRLKVAAQADIEQEVSRARELLRAEVATLAVAGAEKILGAHIDHDENGKLVEQMISEL